MPASPSSIQTSLAWSTAKDRADSPSTVGASGMGRLPKSRAGGMNGIGR